VPVSGQQLFFQPADREDPTAQRDLACHCDVALDRNPGQSATNGGRDRYSGRRPILRYCAFRHVDVNVQVTVEIAGKTE
jgi:hypothetical protein